jgi:hypothetical protein
MECSLPRFRPIDGQTLFPRYTNKLDDDITLFSCSLLHDMSEHDTDFAVLHSARTRCHPGPNTHPFVAYYRANIKHLPIHASVLVRIADLLSAIPRDAAVLTSSRIH